MTEIEIHEVHVDCEAGLLTLAVSGTVEGDSAYLILSLNERPDAQDVELGLNSVYAEWNDQAHSGYNLVRSAHWSESDLIIDMTELARERGIPGAMLLRTAASHLSGDDRTVTDAILARI